MPRSREPASDAHSCPPPRTPGTPLVNLQTDLSFITLVTQASVVVQGVLVLLVALSLWSWWQIFLKMFQLKRTTKDTDQFENEFWKGGDLNELYQGASKSR